MFKKYKFIFLALSGIVILAFLFLQGNLFQKPSPTPQISEEQNVSTASVKIDYGGGNTKEREIKYSGNLNAYDALKNFLDNENIPYEVTNYDFGVFVKSINGKESTENMAWIYYVNGESGTIAADKYNLKDGDKLEWKYIAPSE